MPDLPGDEILRQVRKAGQDSEFLLFSSQRDFEVAVGMMPLGACGYIMKPFNEEEIRGIFLKLVQKLDEKNGRVCGRSRRSSRFSRKLRA